MKDFINKHKERVALGGMAVAFVFFVGGGIYLQKHNRHEKVTPPEKEEIVALKKSANDAKSSSTSGTMTAFFLKPSASELLEELAEMEDLNQDVIEAKFLSLRVLWQAYFFSASEADEGKTSLLLDVSDDGFGVEIQSEVRGAIYPQIATLKVGDPLWIAGEILAVDPAGTGTVYLKCEYLSFGPEPPLYHHGQGSEGHQSQK